MFKRKAFNKLLTPCGKSWKDYSGNSKEGNTEKRNNGCMTKLDRYSNSNVILN